MALEDGRLPSLKDKYRDLSNRELQAKTEEIKKDTKDIKEVKEKVAKKTK